MAAVASRMTVLTVINPTLFSIFDPGDDNTQNINSGSTDD
jgi:hypothetical protein